MDTPLYNSRIVDTYIRFIKNRYSSLDVTDLLKSADMKAYEVADQGHWFTQDQIDRFYEKLVQLTGNEHLAREAGRYAASPEALGAMRQYTLGLIGPAQAFALVDKAVSNLTRSATYTSRKISANSVEIVVTPREGIVEKPFQCENRIGFFEAVVLIFGLKLPRVEHGECLFKGAKSCRYVITWERSRALLLKRIWVAVTLLCVMISLTLAARGHWPLLKNLLQLFVPGVLLLAALIATLEKNELKANLDNTHDLTEKLIEQIDSNFNNALLINEIGQVLNSCTHREEILALVIKIMEQRLEFDRGMIMLANQDKSRLVLQAAFGYSPAERDLLTSLSFHLDRPESKGVFVISFREQRPFLINDLNEIEETLSAQSLEFAKKIGTRSFICCPIVSENRSIGVLAVDNVKSRNVLVASDVSRLTGIASVISISLRNLELIEAKIRHEKEQLRIDKLESLGILAGGIAHDFNNVLTGILGNISFAHMFLDASHQSYKPLAEAEKAAIRAGELAHQLLTFARGGEPLKKTVSVQQLVSETLSLVLHGSNVKASVDISDSIQTIEADEGQLSQVFHNLIINATQAMPGGGILTVTAQNVQLGPDTALSLPPGSYIRLTCADQGCGISADNLKRIFDPYFTTKTTGNGLGLASVHSIIIRHGGHIGVSSVPGTGTTFTIHLPAMNESQARQHCAPVIQASGSHTGGSILVMDDEEMIRNMTAEMLAYFGYQVTTCESGTETIALYTAAINAGAPFGAVIMDLTIPGGMGGREAAEQILSIDPQACLIVSSGYSNDPIMSDFRSHGFSGAVAKPYHVKEFGLLLSSLLADRPVSSTKL